MPPAQDWDNTFLPAVLTWLSGGDPYQFIYNPPWVVFPLIPFALIPYEIGRIALLIIAVAIFCAVAMRFGARRLSVALFVTTPFALSSLFWGNVEWLALAGALMPLPVGLLFLALKPQVTLGFVVYALVSEFQENGWRSLLKSIAPLVVVTALSFVLFGNWVGRTLSYNQYTAHYLNTSLFPYSLLPGAAVLLYAIRHRKPALAIAASPCFFLVLTWQTWMIAAMAMIVSESRSAIAYLATWGWLFYQRGVL